MDYAEYFTRFLKLILRPAELAVDAVAERKPDRKVTPAAVNVVTDEEMWRDLTPTAPINYLPPESRPMVGAFDELEWPEEKTKEIRR